MTRQEFKSIVAVMKSLYTDPKFIADQSAFDVWYDLLGDMDATELLVSVKRYMQTEKFPPYPADLRKVTEKNYLSPDEAWAMVSDSLWGCTSRENAVEEFNKLPEEVQYTLGSSDALYSYTQGEWNESVNKALFVKNYKPTVERLKSESRLSKPLQKGIGVSEQARLEER